MLALAGDSNPPTFQVRLDTPLTSYDSPAGTPFTATVISPLEAGGRLIVPQGSLIHGTVRSLGGGLRSGARTRQARTGLSGVRARRWPTIPAGSAPGLHRECPRTGGPAGADQGRTRGEQSAGFASGDLVPSIR